MVAERVLELAGAVAVELLLDGPQHGGATGAALEHRIDVLDVDAQRDRGAPDGLRAPGPHLGNSSDSMISPSPICSSAWPTLSSASPGAAAHAHALDGAEHVP